MNSNLVCHTNISPNKTSPRNHAIDTITIHCMAGNMSVEKCGELFADPNRDASSNYGIGSDGRIALYVDENDRSWCSSNRANDMRAVTIEVANIGGATEGYPVSEEAMNSLINLVADICSRNGIKHLLWQGNKDLIGKIQSQNMTVHRWFSNKSCPGDYLYNRMGDIASKVNGVLANEQPQPQSDGYSKEDFIRDVQSACGATVDGVAGPETLGKTITVSSKNNRKHPIVIAIQKYLYSLGYTEVGDADGCAGAMFTAAVKHYQSDHGCTSDGVITAKMNTWKCLLGLA